MSLEVGMKVLLLLGVISLLWSDATVSAQTGVLRAYKSPATDGVSSWQDAVAFCQAKGGRKLFQVNASEADADTARVCHYVGAYGADDIVSGGQWVPVLSTAGTEEWLGVDSSTGTCATSKYEDQCGAPKEYKCGRRPGSKIKIRGAAGTTIALSTVVSSRSVCVLHRVSDDTPLGRIWHFSASRSWQRSAAVENGAPVLDFQCDRSSSSCLVDIPAGDDTEVYQLVTYRAASRLTAQEEASRFLAQATYGPTMEEIESLAAAGSSSATGRRRLQEGDIYRDWILHQMNDIPPTLHREYFRRRANQRMHTANEVARPRSPCEDQSRWHRFTFTQEDALAQTVFAIQDKLIVTSVGGKALTEVANSWLRALPNTATDFQICTVEEAISGIMEVTVNGGNCNRDSDIIVTTNPTLRFDNAESTTVISQKNQEVIIDHSLKLLQLEPVIPGVRLLTRQLGSWSESCVEPDYDAQPDEVPILFVQDLDRGHYYRHDGRMLLLENTLETVARPDAMYTSAFGTSTVCPNVDATFLNRDSCYITDQPVCESTTPLNIVCGSPGEVANDPAIGSRFPFRWPRDVTQGKTTEEDVDGSRTSRATWTMVSLHANDQLRQRIAFALYGILVVGEPAFAHQEARTAYYDIFVRNAFKTYRDVLKEVSYHSLMGEYLTFRGSRSLPSSGTLPDENYARELLQLFTVGLYRLKINGDVTTAKNGQPVSTYDINDIMSIARVWTGFNTRPFRGNIEADGSGDNIRNHLDPMVIEMRYHDAFPKTDLLGGYIGDKYPLCIDIPDQDFLRKGSTFDFVSSSESEDLILDSSGSSELYDALCKYSTREGACQYAPRVVLDRNLACNGEECNTNSATLFKVGDAVYKHVPRPCVSLQFFNGGRKAVRMWKDWWAWKEACVDPRSPRTAGLVCCDKSDRNPQFFCPEKLEYVTSATNDQQCQNLKIGELDSFEACDTFTNRWHACNSGCCPDDMRYGWSSECHLQVGIDNEGNVHTMHEVELPLNVLEEVTPVTWYGVLWTNKKTIPKVNTNGCGSCQAVGTKCVCNVTVVEEAVFQSMPSRKTALARLKVGSLSPEILGAESYTTVKSSRDGLIAHHKLDSGGSFDENTIFEVKDAFGNVIFLKNFRSTVTVGDDMASFRNPPAFQNVFDVDRDIPGNEHLVHFEVDALLDHLMAHPNTAPFIAYRFIQRLVTSNPSPTYIEDVARAFQRGTYEGIGSGVNGDLAATVAAVLLHEEARTVALDADPSQGQLREPLLKLMYGMRALKVVTNEPEQQIYFSGALNSKIGQMAHQSESVFSWFKPGHSSLGTHAKAMGLVTPESEIMTTPQVIAYANSMSSLGRYGVAGRGYGAGSPWEGTSYLSFESSSPVVVKTFSLPQGLDLIIENGYHADDPFPLADGLQLVLEGGDGDKCSQNYNKDGDPTHVSCRLKPTVEVKDGVWWDQITLAGSGGSIIVNKIGSWAWGGKYLTFYPTTTVEEVNTVLRPEDIITATYSNTEEKCRQQYDQDDNPSRVRCMLEPTANLEGAPGGKMTFNLTGDGAMFSATIIHWAWDGNQMYFKQDDHVSVEDINAALPPGTPIKLSVEQQDPMNELDLLLTNGRLSADTRAALYMAHNAALGYGQDAALQYAYQLFFLTQEFQVSNIPNGLQKSLPAKTIEPQTGGTLAPAKAIIYLQLEGGADSFNMLVPHSECNGADLYAEYSELRSDLAIPKGSLHQINVPAGSQPCQKFGMHPSLEFLSSLYSDNDLLWVANMGSLVEPLNRDETESKKTPQSNFAHNLMTLWAEKVHTNNNRALGVLGRMADSLKGKFKTSAFSVRRTSPIQDNDPVMSPLPDVISSWDIETLYTSNFHDREGIPDVVQNLTESCSSIYGDLWSSALRQGILRTEELKEVVDANPLQADPGKYWKDDSSHIETSFRQVSRILSGSESLNTDRLTFSVRQWGFDAHFDSESELAEPLAKVDSALESFVAEMKAQGKWDDVVVVIGSEFGRAMVSNGEGGCDHGWGGNYMVLGGSVKGGNVLGKFIESYNQDTYELMMRGGRVIPTTPWEAVWNGIAEWFSVPASQMLNVLPLKGNFPGLLFSGADMFRASSLARRQLTESESESESESQSTTRAVAERKLNSCEIDPNLIFCEDVTCSRKKSLCFQHAECCSQRCRNGRCRCAGKRKPCIANGDCCSKNCTRKKICGRALA